MRLFFFFKQGSVTSDQHTVRKEKAKAIDYFLFVTKTQMTVENIVFLKTFHVKASTKVLLGAADSI